MPIFLSRAEFQRRDASFLRALQVGVCDNSQIFLLLTQLQGSKDRLDLRTYEVELLGAFARAPTVVERQNRHFMPFFLALEPLSLQRRQLKAYLALFAKFVNPNTMHASSALHGTRMRLPPKPDRELALNCLLISCQRYGTVRSSFVRCLMRPSDGTNCPCSILAAYK